MSFPNIYTHRKVADASSKPCDICYRSTTSVLIVPENKDFFFVCPGHLKDKGFCTPIVDEAAVAAKQKKEMEDEIERVKKEFEEKKKKKEAKAKAEDKEIAGESKKDNKEKSEQEKKAGSSSPAPEEEPRVFALARAFYQRRLDKKRAADVAKRNRERLSTPNLFPSVPKDLP